MKVAIVGSRKFANLAAVRAYVAILVPETIVISGGAIGVDTVAVAAAKKLGLEWKVILPDYEMYGPKIAPLIRNQQIATECNRMVAFWDGKSTGTMHAVKHARKLGKPVEIIKQ